MRTQDLNRYQALARALARGEVVPESEIEEVLAVTGHSRAELERRAGMVVERANPAPREESPLERYGEETKVLGAPEGMVIVGVPILLCLAIGVLCLGCLAFSGS